jgi:inosose dehydratase
MRQRNLLKTAALGLGTLAFPSMPAAFAKTPPARKLKIGHTCITWGTLPHPGDDGTLEPAL